MSCLQNMSVLIAWLYKTSCSIHKYHDMVPQLILHGKDCHQQLLMCLQVSVDRNHLQHYLQHSTVCTPAVLPGNA